MTEHAHAHDHHADAGGHKHHVASSQLFLKVLIALLMLTCITVLTAKKFDFGSANMLIAMVIASIKASLVIAIFMHLKWDTAINRLVFLGSFLFLALLFIFTLADEATRGRDNPVHKTKAPVANQWVHPALKKP